MTESYHQCKKRTNSKKQSIKIFIGGDSEMYILNSFDTLGAFTLLRPIYISILVVSLLLLFILLIPKLKNEMINGFTVLSLSAISIFVSSQLLYKSGIIIDEVGLSGDPVSFYIFLAITGIGIINLIIYFSTLGKSNK